MKEREKFGSRLGFILVSAGCAIGIAVIVNKENTLTGLTSEQVLSIYTGETTDWSELQ